MNPHIKITVFLILIGFSVQSCNKYLDAKPDDTIAIVATLTDAQLLLDNYARLNLNYPANSEVQTDNFYLTPTDYNSISSYFRAVYSWQKNESSATEWFNSYNSVLYCNIVLNAYEKISGGQTETKESRNVLGSALLFRAYYFYGLAQLYAPIYDQRTANTDLGIPLRTEDDLEVNSKRSSVSETYAFIIQDLKYAASILPVTPLVKSRPSKPAAFGALAKVYLSMRDYTNAGLYADSCLQLYNNLIDFNTLSKTSAAPFTRFNDEVIFHIRSVNVPPLAPTRAKIDQSLYNSYQAKDLRKSIFYRANTGVNAGTYNFKGNYDGQASMGSAGFVFAGVTTAEMYLIRAEAYARADKTEQAMADLNALLKTRWEGAYTSLTAATPVEALSIILTERRKELIYRDTRWTDMRRLSNEPNHAIAPKRKLGAEVYELKPGSSRYVLALPADVIRLSGMAQNP